MRHAFLVLDLVLAIPAALAYLLRRDLRPAIRFAVALSLPFALTEPLFYPDYWRPAFLFDLADRIGFGLEDVLFVAALAAIATASYPIAARRTLAPIEGADRSPGGVVKRTAPVLAAIASIAALLYLGGVPMIYGTLVAMVAGTAVAWGARPDLVRPAIGGALVTMVVYQGACLSLAAMDSQVFHTVWRTRQLSGVFIVGVPLEEVLYGAASGFAASIVVPHARAETLVRRPERRPGTPRAALARSR